MSVSSDIPGNGLGFSPEDAQSQLEALYGGWDEFTIEAIKQNMRAGRSGSHQTRALLRIAEGSETRLLGEVYMELRREDGPPDIR